MKHQEDVSTSLHQEAFDWDQRVEEDINEIAIAAERFEIHFSRIQDPRIERHKLYPLKEILLIVLCGALCGVDSWRGLTAFGECKLEYLRNHLEYKEGVPCKNTFSRVMSALNPSDFKECFSLWVKDLQESRCNKKGVIAIDGKCLRGSRNQGENISPIYMVSAFATETRLVLSQQKVAEKSNEIQAIPELLKSLALKGQIVTMDSMGTQKKIAAQIIHQKGDYVLALKRNHKALFERVKLHFESQSSDTSSSTHPVYESVNKEHGRIEKRRCVVTQSLDWLEQRGEWEGLKSVVMIEESREIKGRVSHEKRFFISSLEADPEKIGEAVRAHWSIENSLHWILDTVFQEDRCKVYNKNAAENLAIVRHMALNMINTAREAFPKKIGVKALKNQCCWSDLKLDAVLSGYF